MAYVTCRWLNGDDFAVRSCATVDDIKIQVSAVAGRLATEVEVLSLDGVCLEAMLPAPPAVSVIIKDVAFDNEGAIDTLKLHASHEDIAGVERCLARMAQINAARSSSSSASCSETMTDTHAGMSEHNLAQDFVPVMNGDELVWSSCHQVCLRARESDLVVFQILYKYLQDVNRQDDCMMTLLHRAVRMRWAEVIRILLEDPRIRVDVAGPGRRTALHACAKQGYVGWLERILARHAERHTADEVAAFVNAPDATGTTSLHDAVARDHCHIVDILLAVPGIDVNPKTESGWTPLGLAAMINYLGVMERLIRHPHIDVNARDNYGRTALHIATRRGWTDTVEVLISSGIDVNAADVDQATALHDAVINGHIDIIERLIAVEGLDVNARLLDGRTALMKSALFRLDVVLDKLLSVDSIDVTLRDDSGNTAEMIALERGYTTLAQKIASRTR